MGTFIVVELHPTGDNLTGLETVIECIQVDAFVPERVPKSLNYDIIPSPATTIHRNTNTAPIPCGERRWNWVYRETCQYCDRDKYKPPPKKK